MNSKMDSWKSSCLVMLAHILIFLFFFVSGAFGTTITVVNNCDFTVWPAVSGTPGFNSTGFELKQNNSRSFQVTESWEGVLWGRTNCTINKLGQWSCLTGDCGSNEMECYGRKATPPLTEATFSLNQFKGMDSYDVSLIEDYNLRMTVVATGGSGPCQHRGFRRGYNTGSALNWCQGADYTVNFCTPADLYKLSTTKLDSQLKSTDQLLSLDGLFTLGFFGEDYNYLGIWYTDDSQSRKVWVANPKTPIMSSSMDHTLSIDPNTGNLIIAAQDMNPISITDIQVGPNPNVTTTFLDNGNFQLINKIDKSVLWQSFDHPTNVLLPGMKLGTNRKTGQNLILTSWLSNEIHQEGAFTLSWEPTDEVSHKLMIRRRGQPYWTSGNLYDQTFPYMFAVNSSHSALNYTPNLVYNNIEQYFTYYAYSSNKTYERIDNAFPMLVLTPKGQIIDSDNSIVWTPEFCYGYYSDNGCVESSLSQCRREGDTFRETNEHLVPDFSRSTIDDNSSLSISDCYFRCWNDCDCVGFYSSATNGTGCVFWTGSNNYSVKPNDSYTSMYVITSLHLPNSQNRINPTTGKKTKNNRNWIWIIIVAIPLVFFSLGLLWYLKQRKHIREEEERRRRDEYFLELTASESFKDVHQLESNGGKGNDLLIFSFASIMAATCDFSIENKLGQGGFGPVYKGTLIDGQEIAIKRLSKTSDQGLVEFKNELVLIAKLQHTNLVRILGCCIHGEEKMLIYEYMPNKSLDFFLFDENRKVELDWLKRFNIIEGIAQGLLYLHKYSRMRVIHRDLKANNILLDENMNPKISDFGMARMFKQNETEAMTNRVVGTFGYMSPEYIMEGTFSIKSDIFSFGVLILEIVSGRKNSCFVHLDRTFNLIGYAWELWQQGNSLELEDITLKNTCVVQQFLRTVHVALLCVQESAADRPTTSDLISMLLNDTGSLPAPNKPAFFINRVESKSTSDESKPKPCSVNNMTITAMDGR